MTTDGFDELLHRLRDFHEKEVKGWQDKVTDLTKEKCCDVQRMDELFSKNQQLREQQKILNENVKLLENRLRAGLCDRCTVTQDVAKRKQHEFETSQMQSLQHISILVNEINMLRKENKGLLEELKTLRCVQGEQNGRLSKASTPENSRSPDTNPALALAAAMKTKQTVEGALPRQPASVILEQSQQLPKSGFSQLLHWNGQEAHNPQRVSNKLHNTIAVMAPALRGDNVQRSPGVEKRLKSADVPEKYEAVSPPVALKRGPSEEKLQHRLVAPVAYRPHVDKTQRLAFHWPVGEQQDWALRSQEMFDDNIPVIDCYGNLVYLKDYHLNPKSTVMKKPAPELYWHDGKVTLYHGATSSLNRIPPMKSTKTEDERVSQGFRKFSSSDLKLEKIVAPCQKAADKPLDLSDHGRSKHKGAEEQPELSSLRVGCEELSGPKDLHSFTADPPLPPSSPSSSETRPSPPSHQSAANHVSQAGEVRNPQTSPDQNEEKKEEHGEGNPEEFANTGTKDQPIAVVVLKALKTESKDHDSSDSEMTIDYESESNQETHSEDTHSPDRKEKRKRRQSAWKEALSRRPTKERKVSASASAEHCASPTDSGQG
ncbi:RBBP8 N-terminal-like protein isoform X2 [Amia ocellicauda]|uniref:RBBP8 N-terminal-like protein isoform X2 n=1 Tax=Amia ocellicauda TaxID=2972642 RepID=UPI00346416C5